MKTGDHVRITTKNGLEFTGTLLPGDNITLKLDDGYNVGIDERNIKESKVLDTPKKKSAEKPSVKHNDNLPSILLLHTGGTIASKVDYETGATSNLTTPDELLSQYPELQTVANVSAEFLANMSSDDMRFAHYNKIIKAIKKHAANYQGIIVTQGTDTMHYTAAALHYALQGINIPIVLVGSQRSSDRGSSDAATNLRGAAQFITQTKTPGVFVAMHDTTGDTRVGIFWGVNTRKMHTSRRDAFKAINVPQVATVTSNGVELLWEPPKSTKKFDPKPFKEELKIGMLVSHPNMFPEEFNAYEKFDGLVLLGTGLGHMPINMTDDQTRIHDDNKKALEKLCQKMPVIMTAQTIHGRINMQVYSAGRRHIELGVLGHDLALSPETAFIKLAYILSNNLKPEDIALDMGDAIPRTEEGTYE